VPDAGGEEAFKAAWQSLSREDRATLASDAARGLRGRNRKDAAFMLWWATHELKRGPRPGLTVAAAIAVGIIWAQMAGGASLGEAVGGIGSTAIPIILLIPLATWHFRRPKLHRSLQLNAAVPTGKSFEGPPDPEEAERILARAKREGWLRGTRSDRDA
jgi:hypothetical protein